MAEQQPTDGDPVADEEQTCGKGLADQAATPKLMAKVLDAVADNLVAHLSMLTAGDEDTQGERQVYERLIGRHREATGLLRDLAAEMSAHRDLRMGDHDFEAMALEDVMRAMGGLVDAEAQLLSRLERQLAEHRAMADSMGP